MESILVGIDGSERGERALDWAVWRASQNGAKLHLLAVLNSELEKEIGLDESKVMSVAVSALERIAEDAKQKHPELEIESEVVRGQVVDTLAKMADNHDLVVVGSHHGKSIGKSVGGAKGLQISIATKTPTAVIPADWDEKFHGTGITVGVGSDNVSVPAIEFAARAADEMGLSLRLVSAWGLPPLISRSAEVMGGGLQPVGERFQRTLDSLVEQLKERHPNLDVTGEAVEGTSPTKVLLEECKDSELLVMGTHSRTPLGRVVFGSVTHSVLLNLEVPTVIVPVK